MAACVTGEEANGTPTDSLPEPATRRSLPEVSVVDLYVQRVRKIQDRQTAIASMSCAIIENPEENVNK